MGPAHRLTRRRCSSARPNVYAAYLAYTDHEIGRVIQAVEDLGKLDNTLIIYISGDNGSSAEGTLIGTPNEVAMFNGVEVPVADQLKYFYDIWGTDQTYPHMAVGWTWAFDTPFSWTKQIASHFGGTRQGMCIAWPKVIKDAGGIRWQFHHVIDIVPTILEATGIPAPAMVDGIKQAPIEGVSLAYTFERANAIAPSTHHTQYFEMMGDHAIYHDGWIASTKVMRPPWDVARQGQPGPGRVPLGVVRPDQGLDPIRGRRGQVPGQAQGTAEPVLEGGRQKYQVLPLDASVATRLVAPRPNITAGRNVFTCSGAEVTGMPHGDAPFILDTSYTFKAEVEIPEGGAEGMIDHPGRPLWRLWLLPAEGQAGLPLEPGGPQAGPLGRHRRPWLPANTPWSSTSSTTAWAWAPWPSIT